MADQQHSHARVLVVDDDAIMRELLTLHLRDAGYDVLAAADVVEAGRLILREAPDLIILDVEMPYMNGYEFATALKGDPATHGIPLVFLTTREDVDEHAKKLGAEAYLNKPVRAGKLLEVVALFAGAGR
jgi:CheY-like chemotaxis protein